MSGNWIDDLCAGLIVTAMVALATIGAFTLMADMRSFDSVVRQCADRGFVQDRTRRVECRVAP